MSNDPSKYSGTSLLTALVVGVAVGGTLYYLLKPDCPPLTDPLPPTLLACYDQEDLRSMIDTRDVAGARFYLAKRSDGTLSVLAGPVTDDGTHIPDASGNTQFQLFERLNGSDADQRVLNERDAEAATKAASTASKPAWSIDADLAVLDKMRRSGGDGIGVVERNTTNGSWTFDLVPVKIAHGTATQHGTMADMAVGAPCPTFCGRDLSYYLHQR